MKHHILFLMLCVYYSSHSSTWAQAKIWEGSQQQMQHFQQQSQKKTKAFKAWKQQLKTWGLDTNYNHGISLSGKLNTDGWGLGIVYFKRNSNQNIRFAQLHINALFHEKETSIKNNLNLYNFTEKQMPFVFGKVNSIYTLHMAFGKQWSLLPNIASGHTSLHWRFALGPAMAVVKPYYLNLIYRTQQPTAPPYLSEQSYYNDTQQAFLTLGNIYSGSKWTKGWNELNFVPGLHVESSLVLEPNIATNFVQYFHVGINAALYTKALTLLAQNKAYPYQINFFIGMGLGKRWK
jgi:hypothetical protein